MTNVELNKMITDYRELQRLIEEAQAEMDGIRDDIKEEMLNRDTDTLTVGEHKVTWVTTSSSRFNSAALKTANPELYKALTIPYQTRRFCVA